MAERKETHKNYLILIKIDDDDFLLGVDWEEKASKKQRNTRKYNTYSSNIYYKGEEIT